MKSTLSKTKIKENILKTFLFSISSFIFVYSLLQICFNSNTRLRHCIWWERDELINQSKYVIGSGVAPFIPGIVFTRLQMYCKTPVEWLYKSQPKSPKKRTVVSLYKRWDKSGQRRKEIINNCSSIVWTVQDSRKEDPEKRANTNSKSQQRECLLKNNKLGIHL